MNSRRKHMALTTFLDEFLLDRSLLIGFYGGGNYGDELLLEVLQNLMQARGVQQVTIPYKDPGNYDTYHHRFGYQIVGWDVRSLTKSLFTNRQIVVGGGGLWGLDASFKILAFSGLLFGARWLFRKRVYLVGVGYYGSTSRLGRLSAWLAGKAANLIIARDLETYENFVRIRTETYLDKDIAWYVPEINLEPYRPELKNLDQTTSLDGKTILIILRRFAAKHANDFNEQIKKFIAKNPQRRMLVTLMEPRRAFPEGYQQLDDWQRTYSHVTVLPYPHNPLVLFLFFRKYRRQLTLIAPQFHAILTAHLNDVSFLPVAYDNKVAELLNYIETPEQIPIGKLDSQHLQTFADAFWAAGDTP